MESGPGSSGGDPYAVSSSSHDDLPVRLTEEHAGLRADVTGPWPPYSFVDRHEV
jgi:gas vesicle protein GvpL/GvpF